MKRRYECERCGELFDDESDCTRHERECTGLSVENMNVIEKTEHWLNNMSEEEHANMARDYEKMITSNFTSEAVNG